MQITFGSDYKTRGGRTYKGGTTVEVNDPEARSLIARGKAQRAPEPGTEKETPETTATGSAAAEKTTTEKKGS